MLPSQNIIYNLLSGMLVRVGVAQVRTLDGKLVHNYSAAFLLDQTPSNRLGLNLPTCHPLQQQLSSYAAQPVGFMG